MEKGCISAKEIIAFYPDITLFTTSDLYASLDPIVGTWTNERRVLTEIERWAILMKIGGRMAAAARKNGKRTKRFTNRT